MKRAILSILLGLSLSAIGILVAANYINEPPKVVEIWPIALAIGVMFAVWVIQGAIIALLARPQLKEIRILDMTRVYLATQAAGAITPFAGGEIAYQLLALDRRGLSADMGGAVITIRSVLNGAVLWACALIGMLFIPHVPFIGSNSSLPFSVHKILVGVAIAIAVVGALIVVLVAYVRRAGSEEGSEERRGWRAKVSGWQEKIVDYARHYRDSLVWIWRQEPWVVLGCGVLMILYWAMYPLLGTLALRAAGWDSSGWIMVFLAQYVLFIVIPLAPTPGNSGAAEIAFIALMGDYVPHGALLGGVLIWRALNHYSELVVGAFIAGRGLPEDIKFAKQEFGSDSG